MPNVPVTMLTHKAELSYTGEAVKADAYYGFTDGLHTAAIQLVDFVGHVYIEATLEKEPGDGDWFPLQLSGITDYLDYRTATTETKGRTFYGNFVWLRARIDRDHVTETEYDEDTHGRVPLIRLLL